MSTTFPTSLQDLDATRGAAADKLSSPDHVTHHTKEDDTIEALQTKVGIDSSAVTTSLDYIVANLTAKLAESETITGIWTFNNTAGGALSIVDNSASSYAYGLYIKHDRNGAILQSGDQMGRIYFWGYDGVAYQAVAALIAEVDGTPGANDMPSRLTFLTTPDGSVTPAERMRINNAGQVQFPTTGEQTTLGTGCNLLVNGSCGTAGDYAQIGFGYLLVGTTNPPAIMGYLTRSSSGYTLGDLIFATRAVTTDTAPTERMRIDYLGNIGIGATTFGANAVSVLGIFNGTAPAAHVDNEIQIYSADTSDNTSTLALMLEQAVEDIGTFTASHKLKVLINGTAYWISLDAV